MSTAMASTPVLNEIDFTTDRNVIRIARLLIGEGTKLLRESFDLIYSPSILQKILEDPATVSKLKSAVITRAQWDCLYPPLGVTVESTNFDFSLLLTLLMTMCGFAPPVAGWDTLPVTTDRSRAADLARIKCYKESLHSHLANKMEMLDESFLPLWENIKNAFRRIAIGPTWKENLDEAITRLLNDFPVDMDVREMEELKVWYMTETEISKAIKEKKASIEEKHGYETERSIEKELKVLARKEGDAMMKLSLKAEDINDPLERELKSVTQLEIEVGNLDLERKSMSKEQIEQFVQKEDVRKKSHLIKTLFRKIAKDAEDPLKRELKSLIQLQEGVENLGLEGFPSESTEKTHAKTTEPQRRDGVDLNLRIECMSFSGPGLQGAPGSWRDKTTCEKPIYVEVEEVDARAKIFDEGSTTSNKLEAIGEEDPGSLKEKVLHLIARNYLETKPPQSSEELNEFGEYLEKMKVLITGVSTGSLIVIAHCRSLEILDTLWDSYCSGLLNEMAQKHLVTEEILKEFGLTEMKLNTTISEEEYRAGREYFLRDSGNSSCFSPRAVSPGDFEPEPGSECESRTETDSKLEDLQQQNEMEIESNGLLQSIPQSTSNESGPESGSDFMPCELQAKTDSKLEDLQQQEEMEIESNALLKSIIQSTSNESESRLIDKKGAVWLLQDIHAAACLTFPQSAVSKPVPFKCTLLESLVNFPPLVESETLVSSVVQLFCEDLNGSSFNGNFDEKVSVAISHCATKLRGYEVKIRELIDPEHNEWRDLETTNVWQASDIPNAQGDFSQPGVPYALAKVTYCSTYAVICRLKSYTFSTHTLKNRELICTIPAYPDVSVTIPRQSVDFFQLIMKVQEVPQQWYGDIDMVAGPVLHVTCPDFVQLVEPASVTLPISLESHQNQYAKYSSRDVMVFSDCENEMSEWQEITGELPKPVELMNGVFKFQVAHFSRKWILLKKKRLQRRKFSPSRFPGRTPLEAGFFACLCRSDDSSSENPQLRFCCYPVHLKDLVRETTCSKYDVLRYGNGDSIEPLCEGDLINVSPCRGLKARQVTTDDPLMLKFRTNKEFESDVIVRDSCKRVPEVEFLRHNEKKRLCLLSMIPLPQDQERQRQADATNVPERSVSKRKSLLFGARATKRPKVNDDGVKEGCPSLEELLDLSQKLDRWKPLGRLLLDMDESIIIQMHKQNEELEEKAYQMLLHWNQKKDEKATYQALFSALCRIGRKDLAEEFCRAGTSTF